MTTLRKPLLRHKLAYLAVAILACITGIANAQPELVADVNQLKVAFAYNFSKYFTWPENAPFTQADTPNNFVICIDNAAIANGEFNTLVGQLTQNRRIAIQTTPAQAENIALQCHMWYVAAQHFNASSNLLQAIRNEPVLTVSDAAGSRNAGVVIELAEVNNRIQFRINTALMAEKNLNASAFLLRLAQ